MTEQTYDPDVPGEPDEAAEPIDAWSESPESAADESEPAAEGNDTGTPGNDPEGEPEG